MLEDAYMMYQSNSVGATNRILTLSGLNEKAEPWEVQGVGSLIPRLDLEIFSPSW